MRGAFRPAGEDAFRAAWAGLELVRGADGAVTGFELSTGRANGVLFEKRRR